MVSNAIVKSARFLKMPPTTQNLYFHLIMNADDGVVECSSVMSRIRATEDDLRILMKESFIRILSDGSTCFITNWADHNKIG